MLERYVGVLRLPVLVAGFDLTDMLFAGTRAIHSL